MGKTGPYLARWYNVSQLKKRKDSENLSSQSFMVRNFNIKHEGLVKLWIHHLTDGVKSALEYGEIV